MKGTIESNGYLVVSGVLDVQEIVGLAEALGHVSGAGRRGLLTLPAVAKVARSAQIVSLVRSHLGVEVQPVRAIYFNKSSDANWGVAWHQDLTLALRSRAEVPGFGPWSIKNGIPHAQAPIDLLEQMLTVRLHLDDADKANGALQVLPGSHRHGRLSAEQIKELRSKREPVNCQARAGDALLMRPLLLHASGKSGTPRHRRILHLEYAGFNLPPGLAWSEKG